MSQGYLLTRMELIGIIESYICLYVFAVVYRFDWSKQLDNPMLLQFHAEISENRRIS